MGNNIEQQHSEGMTRSGNEDIVKVYGREDGVKIAETIMTNLLAGTGKRYYPITPRRKRQAEQIRKKEVKCSC
jgi:hypothetical protein